MSLSIAQSLVKPAAFAVDPMQGRSKNGTVAWEPEQLKAFAERLTTERKKFPTRTAFCKAVGLSRTTVRLLEKGNQQPDTDTINKLVTALAVPFTVWIGANRIDPGDPRLKDLRDEDFEIAQLFHHASTDARLRIRAQLHGETRSEPRPAGVERRRGGDRRAVASDTAPVEDVLAPLLTTIRARLKIDPTYLEWLKISLALEGRSLPILTPKPKPTPIVKPKPDKKRTAPRRA